MFTSVLNMIKKIWITMIACAMLFGTLMVRGFAEEGKEVTVGPEETYTTIQQALNYIISQEDTQGWTVTVKGGDYNSFSVYSGLDGLTIKAAEGENVTVNTWNGTENTELGQAKTADGKDVYLGTLHRVARNYTVTIGASNLSFEELNFTIGDFNTQELGNLKDMRAAITDCNSDSAFTSTGLTVDHCSFKAVGERGYYSDFAGTDNRKNGLYLGRVESMTVKDSTFEKLSMAIGILGDGYVANSDGVNVSGNTFEDCDFVFSCYFGGNSYGKERKEAGPVNFTGNTVKGNENLRSKISILDQNVAHSIDSVNVSGNKFSDAMIVVENMEEGNDVTVNDVLGDNTWIKDSFYTKVDAYYWGDQYQGKITANIPEYAEYKAPEGDEGYWMMNRRMEDLGNVPGSTEFVRKAIEEANLGKTHELKMTFNDQNQLIHTINAMKDCIYWVSIPTIAIEVNKVWEDSENATGKRPNEVTVELLANGAPTGKTLVLNEENGWSGKFEDLPKKKYIRTDPSDDNVPQPVLEEYHYSVAEKEVTGYTATVSGDEGNGFTITNTVKTTPPVDNPPKPRIVVPNTSTK